MQTWDLNALAAQFVKDKKRDYYADNECCMYSRAESHSEYYNLLTTPFCLDRLRVTTMGRQHSGQYKNHSIFKTPFLPF